MLNPIALVLEEHPEYDFRWLDRELDRAKSKVFLGKSAVFFGPLMCSLDFVWAEGLETAATDGKTFWWDPKDFLRCSPEERSSAIMHELWHVARLHKLRQGNRCPDRWNLAGDILINRDLISMGYQDIQAPWWVVRPEYDHLAVEEDIYDALPPAPGGGGHTPGKCKHGQVAVSPKNAQAMVNATVKAIQSAKVAGQPGAIPGGVEQIVEQFLAPKIPWETHLYHWMADLLDEEYTWRRPNRRHEGIYLPSRYEDDGRLEHLMFYWDVSGSIGKDEEIRMNSEVRYIWNTFKPRKLTLAQFDTRITKVDEWTEGMDFAKVKILGKGGTQLEPVRQHMLDNKPTAAIVFSDLFCVPMAPGPTCPIIWIAIGNKQATVNMGKLIHIKP